MSSLFIMYQSKEADVLITWYPISACVFPQSIVVSPKSGDNNQVNMVFNFIFSWYATLYSMCGFSFSWACSFYGEYVFTCLHAISKLILLYIMGLYKT